MIDSTPYLLIIFCAFGGFLIAFYIRHKKSSREVLVCPLNSNCETVIHSDFSKFFGVPVEVLGLLYYGLIAGSYGILLGLPEISSPLFLYGLLSVSAGAFLFSLYLTFIQAFTLREWCTWCLTSAMLSTVIFLSSAAASHSGFQLFLADQKAVLVFFHIVGMAIGVGGATLSDILFFRFLRDMKISDGEADILGTFSQVIWFAIALILLSGLGIFLGDVDTYIHSSKFLAKMTIVAILITNGVFLNLYITPKLILIFSSSNTVYDSPYFTRVRKISFALGAVSMVSWYSALILGSLESSPYPLPILLVIYLLLIGIAVSGSQILEYQFSRRRAKLF